ncbi:MAG: hypothetical protein EOM20_10630 [Spartobacteria bacterium]|nr:hypothetical protein [Spartobacteria bacterium]
MRNPNNYGSVFKLRGRRYKPWVARITTGWETVTAKSGKYAGQEVRETTLSIGRGVACVREIRHVELQEGEQELVLEALPATLDLMSFQLRALESELTVSDWSWNAGRKHGGTSGNAGARRWLPGVALEEDSVYAQTLPGEMRCRVISPSAGFRVLEIVYLFEPIHWDVEYTIVIHGANLDEAQRLSVDFKGYAVIGNRSGGHFKQALVHLLHDGGVPVAGRTSPGFLLLNEDSPLSDMWRKQAAPIPEKNMYVLPRRVTVAPFSKSYVEYVSASRIPARRLYSMSYMDIPVSADVRGTPLRELIIFDNTDSGGQPLGRALPEGLVTLSKGSAYPQLLPGARIPHTSAGDEIRLDLGPSPSVRGLRRVLSRRSMEDGLIEIVFELQLINDGTVPIRVDVEEKPNVNLQWDVFRSDADYTTRENTLYFTEDVPAQAIRTMRYTVHMQQPEWR